MKMSKKAIASGARKHFWKISSNFKKLVERSCPPVQLSDPNPWPHWLPLATAIGKAKLYKKYITSCNYQCPTKYGPPPDKSFRKNVKQIVKIENKLQI